jgi:hypothetical protein
MKEAFRSIACLVYPVLREKHAKSFLSPPFELHSIGMDDPMGIYSVMIEHRRFGLISLSSC